MPILDSGANTAGKANVDTHYNLQTILPGNQSDGTAIGGGAANAPAFYSEVDAGTKTGSRYVMSPETDNDYRLRVASDTIMDAEAFNYTAQNTGKHTYANSTLTAGWTTSGLTTNSGSVTTTGTGLTFGTYAEFPLLGGNAVYAEFEGSFSAAVATNFVVDFGMFRRGSSTAYAPADGVYFRINSSGIFGVVNYNGAETTTSVFSGFSYSINKKYQFIISITEREVEFWIDNILYGSIETPNGQGRPFLSATVPLSIRHAHTGTTGAVFQFTLNNYCVHLGGINFSRTSGEIGNSVYGSYQGLSGGTMGQLVAGTVTSGTLVKPSAVVPSNTALTAGLGNSLGGRSWETYTSPLATNTDGIIAQYQVPAGTVSVQGKRLKIRGVKLSGVIQTAITGGPFTQEWYLVFGNTATSLQTAEAATTKAPRRVMLPEFTQNITATQAANTAIQQAAVYASFVEPIYVNPGEFVSLVNNWFGTAPSAGVAAYTYQFIYTWE